MADSDVLVEIGAKIDKLLAATEQSNRAIGSIGDSVDSLTGGFKKLGELIGITFTVSGLANFVEKMAELGVRAEQIQSQIGGTGQAISTLKAAAKLAGADFDSLVTSIERASLNIQRGARNAFEPTAQALKVLGLSARDLVGVPVDVFFFRLADATSKLEPSLNRTNALMQVGGRGIQAIIPALDLGSAKFKEFLAEWDKAGSKIDPKVFASTHAELTLLDRTLDSFGKNIFASLQPAINLGIKKFREFIQNISPEDIRAATKAVLNFVIDVVAAMVTLFQQLIDWSVKAWDSIKVFTTGVSVVGQAIKVVIDPIGTAKTIFKSWTQGVQEDTQKAETAADRFLAQMRKTRADIDAALSADEGSHNAPGGRSQAQPINYNAKEQADIEAQSLATRAQQWSEYYARLRAMVTQQVTTERLTGSQGVAMTRQITEEQYQLELSLARQRLKLYEGVPAEQAKINAEIILLQAKHKTEMLNLQFQQINAMRAQWDTFFDSIRGAWDAQLRGLLSKQVTWAQAFRSILGDLLIDFIKWGEKKVAVYIATELAETQAKAAGAVARTVLSESEAVASFIPNAIRALKSIATSAAETFAGVFGFLAPEMGPAAGIPAAAAGAVVAAAAGAVPAFAMGSWSIPRDMLAMVHEGEKITPKGASGGGWQGGGGGDTHVHIHTMDTRSVAQFVRDNAGALAKGVTNYLNSNPSARGDY